MAEQVARQGRQLARPARLAVWVLPVVALIVIAALLWLGIGYLVQRAALVEIPALPDFGRKTPQIARQITDADAFARAHPRSGEALGKLGMAYHCNAYHDRAQTAYQLALRADPTDFRWPYYLALLKLTVGLNEQALAFLTKASELNPDYPHVWARLGELHFRRGAFDEARQAFRKATKLAPNHPHATLGLARLAGLEDNWAKAAELLERALAADPTFGPAHDFLAIAYQHLGRAEQFRRHEGRGADAGFQMNDPLVNELYDQSCTGSILVTQAQIAQGRNDWDRALRLLRRATEVDPTNKDARLAIGRFLAAPGFTNRERLLEAKKHFEVGIDLDPNYVNMRHEYAQALYSLREVELAKAEWEHVLNQEPHHAMALMSLGQIYFQKRDYERAHEFYERGLAIPPDTPFSLGDPGLGYHRLAMTDWALGRTDEALAAFRRAVEETPDMSAAYVDQARLLKDLGRVEEGLAVYRNGIARNPEDATLRLGLGNYLLQIKRFTEARDQLLAALALSPSDARTLSALGFVELELGDVPGATEHLRQALRIAPNFALAHYHLGNALLLDGRRDEAIAHYTTALKLNPALQEARKALGRARGQ